MPTTTRREFMATLTGGAAALGAPALGAPALAEAGPKEPPTLTRVSQALTEIVRQRYLAHDIAAQLKAIEQDIVGNLQAAEILARVPIVNSDEPDFVFVAE